MELTVGFQFWKIKSDPTLGCLKDILFRANKAGSELLEVVLQTYVGRNFGVGFNYDGLKSEVFEHFMDRHRSINYKRVFMGSGSSEAKDHFQKFRKVKRQRVLHYTESKTCENQVHPSRIRQGFQTILYKVVTKELFGNNRNKKKILKAFDNLMRTAKTEQFTLQALVRNINVSSITWLKAVHDEQIKSIVLAKFIKCLFYYFILVISREFHVDYIKEQRVFIRIQDWNKQKRQFAKKMKSRLALIPHSQVEDVNQIRKILFLIPKEKGVRYIVRQTYTDKEKEEYRQSLCVLKYLHNIHFKNGNSDFSRSYIENTKINNFGDEEALIISADIHDAYGSIKLDKLLDMINNMFEKLPGEFMLQWFNTRDSKRYKYVGASTNRLNEQSENSKNLITIKKCDILYTIQDVIYNTKLLYNNKAYSLCKGVAQGLMLSAILCDIYYAHMYTKHFLDFENAGYLCTYVDDSIYITNDEVYANRYLTKIKKGIPEFNCWFNEKKLNSNLSQSNIYLKNKIIIEYLGWKINPCSLEVQPKYYSPRYSISFVNLSILTLESKLRNLSLLKLDSLILSKEINSESRIFSNIQIIAQQQAKRCFAFMSCLLTKNDKLLMKIIHKTNFRIRKTIEILTKWDEKEKVKNNQKLQYIMWQSFYYVFIKKPDFFRNLIKDLKKLMKKYYVKDKN